MVKTSMSHEDYLEAIVMLGGTTDAPVRSVDVANKLGVSKASVNKAISALKEQELVVQPHYGDITLTEAGYAYGRSVLDRHRMLFDFLTKALGIELRWRKSRPARWNTPSAMPPSRNGARSSVASTCEQGAPRRLTDNLPAFD